MDDFIKVENKYSIKVENEYSIDDVILADVLYLLFTQEYRHLAIKRWRLKKKITTEKNKIYKKI